MAIQKHTLDLMEQIYCNCTVDKLSKKFSDEEMGVIFKQKPEGIMKATEFATIECENNK
jgi:hypothetical protein